MNALPAEEILPSSSSLHPAGRSEALLSSLSSLLGNLDEVTPADLSLRARVEAVHQSRLAVVRLGVASGLFMALRAKHLPTAAHSLRVALVCSSWSYLLELSDEQRDHLEVAALLHDVGKIGVPDHILLKPARLTAEEQAFMKRNRDHARDILSSCCASQDVLDIVYYAPAWYDGRTEEFDRRGSELPIGARVLAIVDAFDAMTSDHVYRRAVSRERAMAELFEYAGSQFDPDLIRHFSGFLGSHQEKLRSTVVRRWLWELKQHSGDSLFDARPLAPSDHRTEFDWLFHEQLWEHMPASVVCVNKEARVIKWNHACETLTGITAARVEQIPWDPSCIGMRDEHYKLIAADRCPLLQVLREGHRQHARLVVTNARGDKVSMEAHVAPVLGPDGTVCGATLIMFDASSQAQLEEQMETLHERACQDGLTKVANRAEFNRVHAEMVARHHERGLPYSLIICDLDHFKRINDTYGHQAGDDVLVTFAALLRRYCRGGDLVARYGGEEFVMLCGDCDNTAATARAEAVREAWSCRPHPALAGTCLSASFGVTELQPGDTPDTMLRRADRALLQAKDRGRNAVVQLGAGRDAEEGRRERPRRWLAWLQKRPADRSLERRLITAVPLKLTVEKLRGFVSDQAAEILELHENRLTLQIDGQDPSLTRRASDRPTLYLVDLQLEERQLPVERRGGTSDLRTIIQVTIRPKRERDRRRGDVDERARQLLMSLKAYLMAQDYVHPN